MTAGSPPGAAPEPQEANRWTPEQEDAIRLRGRHLLVSAAAGAGKTSVLVERVIRRLLDPADPVDIDRLLVVTFTEAAAAEMRSRIAERLERAIAQRPLDRRLRRQLALLGRAPICTLHAFCLGIVRQYFFRLGLDPVLRVMDEHEGRLLEQEVLDELFERHYAAGDEGFLGLVERYGGRGDQRLRDLVLQLHRLAYSQPWPEVWLERLAGRFRQAREQSLEASPWFAPARDALARELERLALRLEQAVVLCRRPGGPAELATLLEEDALRLRWTARRLPQLDWEGLGAALAAADTWERLPSRRGRDASDPALKTQVQKLRDGVKQRLGALRRGVFGRAATDVHADADRLAPLAEALVALVKAFDAALTVAKRERGLIDFTDMERHALRLLLDPDAEPGELRPSAVAREFRRRFDEVLVDEYQDINQVQDAILHLVARDGEDGDPNLFMVGDVKQSIYRFRQAEPSLFLTKYRTFPPANRTLAVASVRAGRIELRANFRSRRSVVDAVNFVFRRIMTVAFGGLAYEGAAELTAAADYPAAVDVPGSAGEAPVEVHLLERQSEDDAVADGTTGSEAMLGAGESATGEEAGEEEAVDATALEQEAAVVARRIRELVEGREGCPPLHVWDKREGRYRPARYRDIVVLMRAVQHQAPIFVDVLSRLGVPVYARARTGYFQTLEVGIILALLRLIDNPRQDIPLATVLRSPLVGLTAAQLAAIRLAAPAADYYTALCAAAGWDPEREEPLELPLGPTCGSTGATAVDGELRQRLRRFLSDLQRWRTAARRVPLSRVLEQIYAETAFLVYAAGMPGGEQRRANLEALLERARQFDRFSRQGLFRFLRFIDRLRERGDDLGIAPALGENEDVVRIMSIHQSKGLEFPVVVLANLGGRFPAQQGDVVVDRELGLGFKVADPELRVRYPSLSHWAVREQARAEDLAEELRVLYVAMTRARERLILVGSARNLASRASAWLAAAGDGHSPLTPGVLGAASSYLDWLGPALIRHPDAVPLQRLAAGDAREAGAVGATGGEGDVPPAADAGDPVVTARAPGSEPSRWHIQLWSSEQVRELQIGAEAPPSDRLWERIEAGEPLDRPVDNDAVGELRRRLEWRYPYEPLVNRFAKRSVTELKGRPDPEREEFPLPHELRLSMRRPRFLSGPATEAAAGLSAAERGVATHVVLRHLDLHGRLDEAGIREQVAALVARHLLTPAQAAVVDAAALARFFASPLGRRLRAASSLQREWMFTLALPAHQVYPDLPEMVAGNEAVIVQGIIDCFAVEADGLLLLDFKTDELHGRTLGQLTERYRPQVQLYRRALEEILGCPVKEAYLYFLVLGEAVRV